MPWDSRSASRRRAGTFGSRRPAPGASSSNMIAHRLKGYGLEMMTKRRQRRCPHRRTQPPWNPPSPTSGTSPRSAHPAYETGRLK
jgi:hypothetical protein